MKKWLLLGIALMVLLAVVISVQNILSPASDASEPTFTEKPKLHKVETHRGEYTCLPHQDTRGPQTLECATGIKLDTGGFMALSFDEKVNVIDLNLSTGQRLEVRGLFVPAEELSSDHWQKYDMKGIMQVEQVTRL